MARSDDARTPGRASRLACILALAASLALACRDRGAGPPPAAPPRPFEVLRRPLARPPSDPDGRAALAHAFPADNPRRLPVRALRAFPRLTFVEPVFLLSPPDGSGRVFVVEKRGRVLSFEGSPDPGEARLFLEIEDEVEDNASSGLLGMAFDPGYAENGRFYLHYSTPDPHRVIVARYTADPGDPGRADPESREILLEVEKDSHMHNGGMLAFGPDGMLYVSLGDGSVGGDTRLVAQDRRSLLGKVLRVDVSRGDPYAIPPDNPFVGPPFVDRGVREEIWAIGVRSPWRFSIDPETGEMWLSDSGQRTAEEINLVAAGANLGWSAYEGNARFQDQKGREHEGLDPSDHTPPLVELLRPASRMAVIGGYVYRGDAMPSMRGAYFYGEFISGRVWALWHEGGVTRQREAAEVPWISSFGLDGRGELYAVSLEGEIYRFEETAGEALEQPFPRLLSETGLFRDTPAMIPAEGLIEYDVASPLWSDRAQKRRWIAVPPGEYVGFDPVEPWEFPVGTIFVKHFEIPDVDGDWETLRRLETRALIREESGWAGYTYKWNEEETDATLLSTMAEGAVVEELRVRDPATGESLAQEYTYPSELDCMRCHNGAAGFVLGVRTSQLNYAAAYEDGETRNQLDVWNELGLFGRNVGPSASHPAMADPYDEGAPLSERARSYLAANCSHCHRPDGPTRLEMDLRLETPVAAMKAVGAPSNDAGREGWSIVEPGAAAESTLWMRMRGKGVNRMPPVGSLEVDPAAYSVIGAWIDAGAE